MADEDEVVEEEQEKVTAGAAAEEEEVVVEKQGVQPLAPPKYEVRPRLGQKFQAEKVLNVIMQVAQEQLMGRAYRADQVQRWCTSIANGVRQRVTELNMKRYKIVVTTTIVEMKGAGLRCSQRCLWDPETDDYIDYQWRNDSIFSYTACYGIYMY